MEAWQHGNWNSVKGMVRGKVGDRTLVIWHYAGNIYIFTILCVCLPGIAKVTRVLARPVLLYCTKVSYPLPYIYAYISFSLQCIKPPELPN